MPINELQIHADAKVVTSIIDTWLDEPGIQEWLNDEVGKTNQAFMAQYQKERDNPDWSMSDELKRLAKVVRNIS